MTEINDADTYLQLRDKLITEAIAIALHPMRRGYMPNVSRDLNAITDALWKDEWLNAEIPLWFVQATLLRDLLIGIFWKQMIKASIVPEFNPFQDWDYVQFGINFPDHLKGWNASWQPTVIPQIEALKSLEL